MKHCFHRVRSIWIFLINHVKEHLSTYLSYSYYFYFLKFDCLSHHPHTPKQLIKSIFEQLKIVFFKSLKLCAVAKNLQFLHTLQSITKHNGHLEVWVHRWFSSKNVGFQQSQGVLTKSTIGVYRNTSLVQKMAWTPRTKLHKKRCLSKVSWFNIHKM